MGVQGLFDHRRVDVVATADDQLLRASSEPEIAVSITARQVSGVEPALAIANIDPKPEVLLFAHVPGKYISAANDQNPRLIVSCIPLVRAVRVEYDGLHRLTRNAQSDRADATISQRRVDAADTGGFG